MDNGLKILDGIFPSVPSSPVFPSGVIGLSQKGSELFNRMTATTLLHGTAITGWDPVPIVMARLGLTNELAVELERFTARWQIYDNGWGHWGEGKRNAEWFFRTNMVSDAAFPEAERFPLPMWPFRHMSMESTSVLAASMNESLLQSHEEVIRIFPAFPDNKNGRFKLHARGGFEISSEINSGEVQWICIKSIYGNSCKLELPWNKAVVKSNLKRNSQKISGDYAEIKTKCGEVVMILPEGQSLQGWHR